MSDCGAFDPFGPYVSSALAYADCTALRGADNLFRSIGLGSTLALSITALLTIWVALIGYRLATGHTLSLRDGMAQFMRVGAVLILATQWQAYHTLICDVVTASPSQLLSGASGDAASTNGSKARIAAQVDQIGKLIGEVKLMPARPANGAGMNQPGTAQNPGADGMTAPADGAPPAISPEQRKDLDGGYAVLSITTLASLLSVRAVMAVLLALGPVFIVGLLFQWTTGIFVGWLRVLLGTMISNIAVPMVLSVDSGVIERQVNAIRELIDASQPFDGLIGTIRISAIVGALVTVSVMIGIGRSVAGLNTPENFRVALDGLNLPVPWSGNPGGPATLQTSSLRQGSKEFGEQRLAGILRAVNRPEAVPGGGEWRAAGVTQAVDRPRDNRHQSTTPPPPLGQSRRRHQPRQTRSGTKRDGIS